MLLAVDFDNLHQVLRVLYDEMMPLCGNILRYKPILTSLLGRAKV